MTESDRDALSPNVSEPETPDRARREAEQLEDGSLDPDEPTGEPAWWDEGSDDEG